MWIDWKRTVATLLLAAAWVPDLSAAASGKNVLLVFNRRSKVSTEIAEYYASRRKVPAENFCRVRAEAVEEIRRGDYVSWLERDVEQCIKKHPDPKRLLYIVTTKGVPLKIRGAGGDSTQTDAASVDSELAMLYQRMRGDEAPTAGRLVNPFYGRYRDEFDPERFPIYLVTRLTGYDFEDVRGMIDRSLQARNRGLFVFDQRADPSPGNTWLSQAARRLPQHRVRLDRDAAVVYGAKGVIGYCSWGSNDPQRVADGRRFLGFEWLPGAIASAFVSYNGRTFERPPEDWKLGDWQSRDSYFGGAPQTLIADMISEGATGAAGSVYEPFLDGTPSPEYLFPAYYQGRNLAESFYLSLRFLSWMTVVVGDPLCSLGPPGD